MDRYAAVSALVRAEAARKTPLSDPPSAAPARVLPAQQPPPIAVVVRRSFAARLLDRLRALFG
jgi:hypothetical protein